MSFTIIAALVFTFVFLRRFFMPVFVGLAIAGTSIYLAPLMGLSPSPGLSFAALALGVAVGSATLVQAGKAKE